MNNQKGIAVLPLIIIIVAVVAIAGGVWFGLRTAKMPASNVNKNTNQVIANTNTTNQNININAGNVNVVTNANANIANVNAATNANTNTATDETAGWKTLQSKYGWGIKYPPTWDASGFNDNTAEEEPNPVIQGPTNCWDQGISCGTVELGYDANSTQTAKQFLLNEFMTLSQEGRKPELLEQKERLLGGQEAYEIVIREPNPGGQPDPLLHKYIAVNHNDKIFELLFSEERSNEKVELPSDWRLLSTLEQILSTFQFTEDITVWKTYTNSAIGYSVKYPNDWSLKVTNEPSDLTAGQTARFITITNPVTKHSLHLGARKTGDTQTDIWYRTGIGAGDFQAGDTVIIGGTQVQSTRLVYQSKAVEIFYSPVEHATRPVVIGSYDISAYFSNMTDDGSDLTSSADYQTANTILSTLTLAK